MTTTPNLLQACPLPPVLAQRLPELGPVTRLYEQADPAAFLAEHGAQFNLLITSGMVANNNALIASLPKLQAVCSMGVGYETIDVAAANARGVVVSNTPDVLNDCVADLAIGLLLDVVRGISASDRHVRRGDWPAQGPSPVTTKVSGKRLGLLGIGRIGQAIARRAQAFDLDIRYNSRSARPNLPWQHEGSLTALAEWCDFLVVACSGGPETYHLVSREVLSALGPNGYVVNIARGSVIDEKALVELLSAGQLGGAGLDVFEEEPAVPEALFKMDNVVLQSHMGSGTRETRKAMADLVFDNAASFIREGRLLTPIS